MDAIFILLNVLEFKLDRIKLLAVDGDLLFDLLEQLLVVFQQGKGVARLPESGQDVSPTINEVYEILLGLSNQMLIDSLRVVFNGSSQ